MLIKFLTFLGKVFIKCCEILFKKSKILTPNQKTYLNVPYHEKDQAKRLGAKWDSTEKRWFVPSGVNIDFFARWLPLVSLFNLKAPYFYLAPTQRKCFKCGKNTKINAIVLPEDFEVLNDEESEIAEDSNKVSKLVFDCMDYVSIISYIQAISSSAYSEILKYTNNYAINYSATVNARYFMSTCQNCGVVQGDNYSIQEFNSPFSPVEVEDFSKISFKKILVPIMLDASDWSIGYPPIEYYLGDHTVDGMMYVTSNGFIKK
ncbi:putative dNA primase [Rickettsia felis str. Pedreira]|uniref:Putative dNA primase n=1 Tax=Rickettsia felis str. Pedreira TaxID=1359196 RepID=A0A0F3MXK8_RICFI|nr:putative dNA primase [Rickettsia felis str. Pedreira]